MTKFAEHIEILKNGKKCIIREAKSGDAQQLINLANHLFEDGEGQVLTPGELKLNLEGELEWIQDMNSNPSSFLVVAEVGAEVVGILDFNPKKRKRWAHTGEFGMGIASQFRGLGIGRLLLKELIVWAKNHAVIEKLNLRVISTNERAIQLYESLGFKKEGLLGSEFKFEDGSYADDVLMGIRIGSK